MNLYKLYSKPNDLPGYESRHETIAPFAWEKYKDNNEEIEKRKHIFAKDPEYAFRYAIVTKERFPEGEKAIASNSLYAYWYARNVIKGRFPEGEEAIASDPGHAMKYENLLRYLKQ